MLYTTYSEAFLAKVTPEGKYYRVKVEGLATVLKVGERVRVRGRGTGKILAIEEGRTSCSVLVEPLCTHA